MLIDSNVEVLEPEQDIQSVIKKNLMNPEQTDAFFVLDLGDVVTKPVLFKKHFPNITPFFAIKSNNIPMIAKVLAAMGVNFDCASEEEIKQVLSLGVHPDRIIYAQTIKMPSHLRYAASQGVLKTTFDCSSELHKIKALHPKAELILRIRCYASKAIRSLSCFKLGCSAYIDAPVLLREAKELGLNVVGVSFHVGSDCFESEVFRNMIMESRQVFEVGTALGHKMTVLDIGGGFPGNKNASIEGFSKVINEAIDQYFPDENVKVIAEPGRFFVASCSTLVCSIISKRAYPQSERSSDVMSYCVNESIYNSFNFALYQLPTNPYPLEPVENDTLIPSTIWGQSCDGNDKIMSGALLPDLDLNSWIAFENMGAYTNVIQCDFNGYPKSKIRLVIDLATFKYLKELSSTISLKSPNEINYFHSIRNKETQKIM